MTCGHRRGLNSTINGSIHVWNCEQRRFCTENDHGRKLMDGSVMAVCDTCVFHTGRAAGQKKKLTIGMAYYRDWPGLWATIQSIRLNHQGAEDQIEIVVIDNDPAGKPNEPGEKNHSFKAKQLCEKVSAKYEHFVDVHGTAAAKGRVFDVASCDWVMVVDCHVLFPSMTLELFIGWIGQQPEDCRDLIHGPLIGDGGIDDLIGTHMRPEWGSLMYGQWAVDGRVRDSLEPFEIPMHGCGLFACRRDQWPGFHPLLRGFGPEEWHLHQRVRRNGGKVICLPLLLWCHRFGNPDGTPPPGLSMEDRLRGHLITWLDTGEGDSAWFDACKRHFIESGMKEKDFADTFIRTRREFDSARPVLGKAPGTNLANLLKTCGVHVSIGCDCEPWIKQMDEWGVQGCVEHRQEIIDRLADQAKRLSAKKILSAGILMMWNGVRPTIGSLVDKAIDEARSPS